MPLMASKAGRLRENQRDGAIFATLKSRKTNPRINNKALYKIEPVDYWLITGNKIDISRVYS